MTRTAIVLITYNRLPILKETLKRVHELTEGGYDLFVADDGSSDGSAEYCRSHNIKVVTGRNRGIAANKNRGLFAAMNYSAADVILLLEDDCQPDIWGWNQTWVAMTLRWQHVCFGPGTTWPAEYTHAGTGSVEDPYRTKFLTAQMIGVTRTAVNQVGYLSPYFKRYGHEHVEWTYRFAKHGYFPMDDFVCCNFGLALVDAGTFYTKKDVDTNGRIMKRLVSSHHKKRFQPPWKNVFHRRRFLTEIRNSLGVAGP